MISSGSGQRGKKIAFVEQTLYRTVPHTYAGIQDGIERAAASLRELGVNEGDRVILWGENSARWVMTFYACVLSASWWSRSTRRFRRRL